MAGPCLESYVLDNGLSAIRTNATHLVVCQAEPTHISLASVANASTGAANALGWKSFGANGCFTVPADSGSYGTSGYGRIVTSTTVTDGNILTAGTANWWAVVISNTQLIAHGSLSQSQVVASGNTFSLTTFTIKIPAQ